MIKNTTKIIITSQALFLSACAFGYDPTPGGKGVFVEPPSFVMSLNAKGLETGSDEYFNSRLDNNQALINSKSKEVQNYRRSNGRVVVIPSVSARQSQGGEISTDILDEDNDEVLEKSNAKKFNLNY